MTGVPDTPGFNVAAADGVTTIFNFAFFVYEEGDFKVFSVLNDVETPITSGITKAINSSFVGGTVTFAVAPLTAVGDIIIRREVDYDQTTEFSDITRLKETAIEVALNNVVLQIQQLRDSSTFSLKYLEASSVTNPIISTPTDGQFLTYNGTTGSIDGSDPSSISLAGFDTLFTGLNDDDSMYYDQAAALWKNETPSATLTRLSIGTLTTLKTKYGLGDIVESDIADFATSAQGTTADSVLQALLNGYKSGVILSNNAADASHDIDVTAGVVADSANASMISVSALTKRIDASWSTGTNQGGLSSSLTVANSTWYHVFVIKVAGVDDVGFDTSITAANLVADHGAAAYRRIGSILTDGSANIVGFQQNGDRFDWNSPTLDISVSQTTTAALRVVKTPLGISVAARLTINNADGQAVYVSDPEQTDLAASTSLAPLASQYDASANQGVANSSVMTDTSSRVRTVASATAVIRVVTTGWTEFF